MFFAQGKLPTNLGPMMTDGMHCLQDRIKWQSSSREAAKQSVSQNNSGGSSKLPKSRVARQPFHTEAHKAVAMDEKLARVRNWQPWAWDGKQDWSVARISVLANFYLVALFSWEARRRDLQKRHFPCSEIFVAF